MTRTRVYHKYTFACNDTYACDALIEITALEYRDVNMNLTCVCGSATTLLSQEPMLSAIKQQPRYKDTACGRCGTPLVGSVLDSSRVFYCHQCAMDKLGCLP